MSEVNSGSNKLVEAAAPLLVIATQVQKLDASAVPSKDKFMQYLTREIKVFEDKIKRAGYTSEVVDAANYSICSLLDDMIIYNKIGLVIQWNGYELLRSFAGENLDGKNFFVVLDTAMAHPTLNLDLLELLYLCLILGFEGKYREQKKGRMIIDNLVNELYGLLRRYRGEVQSSLLVQSTLPSTKATQSDGVIKKHISWERWLIGGLVIAIGAFVYLNWNMRLNDQLSIINDKLLIVNG